MKKNFLISFMIENIDEEHKILDILTHLTNKYNLKNLEVQRKIDNESYTYLHVWFHDVSSTDEFEIKNYINKELPNINKGWID